MANTSGDQEHKDADASESPHCATHATTAFGSATDQRAQRRVWHLGDGVDAVRVVATAVDCREMHLEFQRLAMIGLCFLLDFVRWHYRSALQRSVLILICSVRAGCEVVFRSA